MSFDLDDDFNKWADVNVQTDHDDLSRLYNRFIADHNEKGEGTNILWFWGMLISYYLQKDLKCEIMRFKELDSEGIEGSVCIRGISPKAQPPCGKTINPNWMT